MAPARSSSPAAVPHAKAPVVVSWVLQAIVAVILAQTLFFKFTGAPEAKHIFTALGVEPWGRVLTGVLELLAAVMVLVPRTAVLGAALALGLMAGAVASHLGPLGIEVMDDGGLLFGLALTVALASAGILWIRRDRVRSMLRRVLGPGGGASRVSNRHSRV